MKAVHLLFSVSLHNVKCLMNKATFITLYTVTYASYGLIVQWRVDTNFSSQIFNKKSIRFVSIHNAVSHSRCCSKEITINPSFLKKPAKNTILVKALTVEIKVQSSHSCIVLFQFSSVWCCQHLRLYSIMTQKGCGRKQSCPKVPNQHLPAVTERSWCHRWYPNQSLSE
jgi:hypothetical protein